MKRILNIIRRGLVTRKLLTLLQSKGILIQPYFLYVQVPEEKLERMFAHGYERFEGFFIGLKDIDLFDAIPYADPVLYRKRLIEGKLCYGMRCSGRLAAFTWIDLAECNYEGDRFTLNKDETYNFDS